MADTIFGKIIRREIPADIVYEDDDVLAFHDVSPQAPVHLVVIPKKPLTGLLDAAPEDAALLGHLLAAATQIARTQGLDKTGFRVVINSGSDAGQSVEASTPAHLRWAAISTRKGRSRSFDFPPPAPV